MITTNEFRSNATKPEANIRGVTNRCTGLMPNTSIASISSRIVRDPKSAHRRRAGTGHDQHRHQRTHLGHRTKRRPRPTEIRRAELPQQNVQREDTNTVNGIATNNVGANDTRATNHACSKLPPLEAASRNTNRTASADIANRPPTAAIGPDTPDDKAIPGDHRSAARLAIGVFRALHRVVTSPRRHGTVVVPKVERVPLTPNAG